MSDLVFPLTVALISGIMAFGIPTILIVWWLVRGPSDYD